MQPILILWTCKDREEAAEIAKDLIKQRLIACASIIPSVHSLYRWNGKIEQAEECKVFLKTARTHFMPVQDYILAHCSYEVPEILQLSIEQGNSSYFEWLKHET